MDIDDLVKITARAWALPILARLGSGTPGRQAPLIAATGAGRTAFGQSLDHLIELGLVERNPGHGHPLRPEYRLTARGRALAPIAARIAAAAPAPEDQALLRQAWSLPVLAACATPQPFGAIAARLAPVTDRALSLALKRLERHGWLRRVTDTAQHPPRPFYTAQGQGAAIAALIAPAQAAPE